MSLPRWIAPLVAVAVAAPLLPGLASAVQAPRDRVDHVPAGTEWIAGHVSTGIDSHTAPAPAWFRAAHGDGWTQRVHGPNGMFRHLWGAGVEVDPAAVDDPAAARAVAEAFWDEHAALLPAGVSVADLEPWSNERHGDLRLVSLRQTVDGVPVLRASVFVAIRAGRLVWAGERLFPSPAAIAEPLVSAADAAKIAVEQLRARGADGDAGAAELALFPVIGVDRVDLELVQVVPIDGVPAGRWTAYVDAVEGSLLALRDERLFLDATVEIAHHERNPAGAATLSPASYLRVTTDAGNTHADVDGVFSYGGAQTDAELAIRGLYVDVENLAGNDLTASFAGVADGDVLTWTAQSEYDQAQLHAYRYHADVHQFADRLVDDVGWIDERLTVNVNYGDNCNAWFDGELTFLRAGNGCNNTALLADVVYHEFGHGFHYYSVVWGVGDFYGDVSEAFSDTMSFLQTGDAVMAPEFFTDGSGIREVATDRVYPDDVIGEVHYDGLILGGALWDLRTILIDELGPAAGQQAVEEIFAAMVKTTSDLPSSYEAALLADDDNGDLADGTPNVCAIDAAFGPHGLIGASVGALAVEHQPIDHVLDGGAAIPIEARIYATHPECAEGSIGDVRLVYSTDGGDSWDSVGMTAVDDEHFEGALPAVDDGTQLRYRIEVDELESGTTLERPSNPADPGYYVYVGELEEILCDDFEGEDAAWTHELLSGQYSEGADDWMRGVPGGRGGDPDEAFSGSYVWGNDLSPEENWDGQYQASKINTLMSPVWDLSEHDNVRLQFRRWLGVEDAVYDHARIYVNEELAWSNAVGSGDVHHQDLEWILFDLDITEWAAGQSEVQLRWEIESDQGLEFGGWTLDDVCLYSASATAGDDDDDDDDDDDGDDDDLAFDDDDDGKLTLNGDCSCRLAGERGTGGASAALALLAAGLIAVRRRAR